MITDEKIKNKHENQRWEVAHDLYIGAADQPVEQAGTDTQKSHDRSDNSCQHSCPDTQANGGKKPQNKHVRLPTLRDGVESKKVLWNGAPVPFILQPGLNPIDKIDAGGCNDKEHGGIERR